MKYLSAIVSFTVVFVCIFILGGLFLMPHLPPVPDHIVTIWEAEYWKSNWAGAVLGFIIAGLSARSVLKQTEKREAV